MVRPISADNCVHCVRLVAAMLGDCIAQVTYGRVMLRALVRCLSLFNLFFLTKMATDAPLHSIAQLDRQLRRDRSNLYITIVLLFLMIQFRNRELDSSIVRIGRALCKRGLGKMKEFLNDQRAMYILIRSAVKDASLV